MIKELKEEIKFIIENPKVILVLLTISGILPALVCGMLFKMLGM